MTNLPQGVTFTIGSSLWVPEQLVHTTETPGGLKECRFSLSSKGQNVEIDDKLVIYDAQFAAYPFVGRIAQIHKTGLCFDFTATRSSRLRPMGSTTGNPSPAHPSGTYSGRIYKAGTLVQQTIIDAMTLCEDIFNGTIVTLAQQYVADSQNMFGYTPEQMWNYVAAIFSSLESPLLWHIRGRDGLQLVDIDFQDLAARYRTYLPEDQIEENWDSDQIITGAYVQWGNDQAYEANLASVTTVRRKLRHEKAVNGSNDLTTFSVARDLGDQQLARFGQFGCTTTRLTLDCNKNIVQAKPPVGDSDNWPLHLVEAGHGIFLSQRPVELYPYNEGLKYIVGTEYNWDTGKLTCECGIRIGGLQDRVEGIVDYNVNRLYNGPYNGPPGASAPLADADLVPQVGGELDSSSPPSTSYGTPAFKTAVSENDPNVKYGKQIDPDLVADEGLEANINFDPSTSGFQAAIRVTPGTFSEYRLLIGDTTGLVGGTLVAELYRVIPVSESPLGGTQLIATVKSNGVKDRTDVISPAVTLKRGDYYMIKVTTTVALATWAALSLHAKKNFPALKS